MAPSSSSKMSLSGICHLLNEAAIEVETRRTIPGMPWLAGDGRGSSMATAIKKIKKVKDLLAVFPTNEGNIGLTRSVAQLIFHDECLAASLGVIVGPEYEAVKSDLETHFKINNKYMVGFQTSRRVGKTTSMAMFLACMTMCLSDFTSMIVAFTLDQSQGMLQMVQSLMKVYYNGELPKNVVFTNKGMVFIHPDGKKSVLVIKAARVNVSAFPFLFLFFPPLPPLPPPAT